MTFVVIDLVAIALGVGILGVLAAYAGRAFPGERVIPSLGAHVVVFVALAALTAVFDSAMVFAGFTHYEPSLVTGLRLWRAPIEDFAYPVFATLVLPSLFAVIVRIRHASADTAVDGPGSAAAPVRGLRAMGFLLRSSRPYSWVNTAYPFGFAYLLAGGRATDAAFVVGVLLFLFPYNMLMYGINDVFDYESDRRNPRKAGIEGVVLDPSLHRLVVATSLGVILPFVVAFAWASSTWATVALLTCLIAVLAYSVPILRFKERALLDSITSSIHFVGPAIVGLVATRPEMLGTASVWAIVGAFFFWGMSSHLLGAVQDTVADREAGIGSTATRWGARTAARLATAGYGLAGVLLLAVGWPSALFAVLAVPYVVIAVPYVNVRDVDAAAAHRAWRSFLWLNPVCGAVLTIGVLALWVAGLVL